MNGMNDDSGQPHGPVWENIYLAKARAQWLCGPKRTLIELPTGDMDALQRKKAPRLQGGAFKVQE